MNRTNNDRFDVYYYDSGCGWEVAAENIDRVTAWRTAQLYACVCVYKVDSDGNLGDEIWSRGNEYDQEHSAWIARTPR